jgi:streptogramin lyase
MTVLLAGAALSGVVAAPRWTAQTSGVVEGTGFHTFSPSTSGRVGFGAGSKGSIGKLATSGR